MNCYSIKFTSNVPKDYLHLYVLNKMCLQSKRVGLFVQRKHTADGKKNCGCGIPAFLQMKYCFCISFLTTLWQSVLYPTEIIFLGDWVLLKIPLYHRRHWKPKHIKKLCLCQRVYILYWKNKVGFCFHWLLQTTGAKISNLPELLKNNLSGKLHFFIWYHSILLLDDMFKGINLRNQKGSDSKIFSLRKSWLCNLVQNTDIYHSPHAAVPTTLTFLLQRRICGVFFSSVGFVCLELKFGLSYQTIT